MEVNFTLLLHSLKKPFVNQTLKKVLLFPLTCMHYCLESLLASLPIDINLLVTIHTVALGSSRCYPVVILKKMWKIGLKWEASFDIRIIIQLNYICIFKRGSLCRLLKFGREIGTATYPLYPTVL